jgi:hypothetical protein
MYHVSRLVCATFRGQLINWGPETHIENIKICNIVNLLLLLQQQDSPGFPNLEELSLATIESNRIVTSDFVQR